MPDTEVFIDTNILLYLLSADNDKADRAEMIVQAGGLISVQVLNEMANAARNENFDAVREISNELIELNLGELATNADLRICAEVPVSE